MTTMNVNFTRLLRTGLSIYRQFQRQQGRSASSRTGNGQPPQATSTVNSSGAGSRTEHRGGGAATTAAGGGDHQLSQPYPGDYRGQVRASYDPHPDGKADPGEIVWTWVPYQEDHSRGKDRPVLIVGRNGQYLLALMLTSKDHNNARTHDDHFVDIGTGDWDRAGRPSEVRVDRVLQVLEADIRRDGAVLGRDRFNAVIQGLQSR
ncbi:type II toxin-antitoxin system PemK/MazF family toxin [Kocuria sp.]|uniref:type II toxin-antitoxin system PemK/MazF family toxin n=1 Tax=Kocuria sp. TaxID=1871328 RepID=UPI0026DF062A|nr:type II toxin-antitoxin system PemK/MazF family toxin [Kocuria sp.]MDO5617683.1 type II toxin-antitoxin system PemK/MazF family toxin [Kocuria sp.]